MELENLPRNREKLLVALCEEAPPKLLSIQGLADSKIKIDGDELVDAGLGDWLGFYDWLRDYSENVIGIRLWLDQDLSCIELVRACVNTAVTDDGRNLMIFFGTDRDFSPFLSDDQDFGGNRLLIGTKTIAFTFNAPVDR